jgi:hypothetical protein
MKIKIDEHRYIIPVNAVQHFVESFEKIESKREKLIKNGRIPADFPAIKLDFHNVSEEIQEELNASTDLRSVEKKILNNKIREKQVYVAQISSNELPILNNWRVLGYITKNLDSEKYTMSSYNKTYPIPQKYRDTDPCYCDSCGHNRKRNNTYILENTETNENQQVGSTCMDEYVNKETMEMLMLYSNAMKVLEEYDPEESKLTGSRGVFFLDKLEYLATLNANTRTNNRFISKGKSDFNAGRYPTLLATLHKLDKYSLVKYADESYFYNHEDSYGRETMNDYKDFITNLKVEDIDYQKAEEVIEWYENNPPTEKSDEYYFNLHSVMTNKSATLFKKDPVTVCYAIQYIEDLAIKQKLQKEQDKKEKGKLDIDVYIGTEKDKFESIELQLMNVSETETDFGWKANYNFVTQDGRSVYWGASNLGRPDCFDYEKFPEFDDIINFVKQSRVDDKPIWFKMKGGIAHSDYYNYKNERVQSTKISRANSISSVYHAPLTDGIPVLNKKFTMNEFKINSIKKGITQNTGTSQYQYELEDCDGSLFKYLPTKKIPNLKVNDFFQTPMQFADNKEILGLPQKQVLKIENFTEDFDKVEITKGKMSKFNNKKPSNKI